ncbi:hypothetical protein P5704_026740 (plasmid) [Pseudomonas sp. FeN3W]|nr:hypothetical protein P5704_026740 [Pseudomonas sp. FeN3W]
MKKFSHIIIAMALSSIALLSIYGVSAVSSIDAQASESLLLAEAAGSESAPLENLIHMTEQKQVGAASALALHYAQEGEHSLRDRVILDFLKGASDLDSYILLSRFSILFDNKSLGQRISQDFDEIGEMSEITLAISSNPGFDTKTQQALLACLNRLEDKYTGSSVFMYLHIEYILQKKFPGSGACSI